MTLGPQIVSSSYGGLLKFLPAGETGVSSSQVQISDGKGKVTPLYISTSSILVDAPFSASNDIIFDGLTNQDYADLICVNTATGKLFYFATSSIKNVMSSSYALTSSFSNTSLSSSYAISSSYAVSSSNSLSASYAPNDNDWTIGNTFMTASGQPNINIPGKVENGNKVLALGNYSQASGLLTTSSKAYSKAEGIGSVVLGNGDGANASGYATIAYNEGQTVLGSFNKTAGVHPDDIFIVGTGLNPSTQQDALKVRMGTGQTILPQVLVSADPTDPTLPGLYFGEPSTVGSIRLVSSNGGNLLIQRYSGATWTTLQNII